MPRGRRTARLRDAGRSHGTLFRLLPDARICYPLTAHHAGEGMEQAGYVYIVVLAVFVIAGRKFLDAWRDETPKGPMRRLVFGGLCFACFLVVAFFEIRL